MSNRDAPLIPEILERLGPQTLSEDHRASVQVMVKRLQGTWAVVTYATTYDKLRQHFRAGKYTAIPDARWDEVVAWFRRRLPQ